MKLTPFNRAPRQPRWTKPLIPGLYLAVWALLMVLFWCILDPGDAFGYGLLTFYLVLPGVTLVLSFLVGMDRRWGPGKWAMLLFFAVMYLAADYGTFPLANVLASRQPHLFPAPHWEALLRGALFAAVGLVLGTLVRHLRQKRAAIQPQ